MHIRRYVLPYATLCYIVLVKYNYLRLNVFWVDVEQKGKGLTIKSAEAKASQRGFILKKSQSKEKAPPIKNLLEPLDPPS